MSSRSLTNKFGSNAMIYSKSLTNVDDTTLLSQQVKSLQAYIDSINGTSPSSIPDPLIINNLIVTNIAQISNASITNTITVGGTMNISNAGIVSANTINLNSTSEVNINPNLTVNGAYTHLYTTDTNIKDPSPIIGYIDPLSILSADPYDRGLEINYITGFPIYVYNKGFMGYDVSRDRFVLWKNASETIDKIYERDGSGLNSLDIDTVYTTNIKNPDYLIGGVPYLDITIDATDNLNLNSQTETHTSNSIILQTVSLLNSISLDDINGIFLNSNTKVRINPKLVVDIIESTNPSTIPITINNSLNCTSVDNTLAADRLIFTTSITPVTFGTINTTSLTQITAPLNNAGILYYDGTVIKGVTDPANANEFLRYDGTDIIWDQVAFTLQDIYNNGIAGNFGIIDLNLPANTGIIIRDNSVDGILFQVTNNVGFNRFKVERTGNNSLIVFGEYINNSTTTFIQYLDDITVDHKGIRLINNNNTLEYMNFIANPSNSKYFTISYNVSLKALLCDVLGVTYNGILGVCPALPGTGNLTMWYHGGEFRFKVGAAPNDIPFAFSPNTLVNTNSILMAQTTPTSQLLKETGLTSPNTGELTVPNKLIANNVNNNVAANKLLFSTNLFSISNTAPSSVGGVFFYNGVNFTTVSDVPVNGQYLQYLSGNIVWSNVKATYQLLTTSYTVASGIYTTIANLVWDNTNYALYNSGMLIYYLRIPSPGSTFNLDIKVTSSNGITTYASATGVTTTGIKNLNFSSLPASSDYLLVQVKQSGVGPTSPIIDSMVVEYNY